jgi:hypothetical protein
LSAALVFVPDGSGLRGTIIIPPTFAQLVQRADLIFVGQVLAARSEWRQQPDHKVIKTLVTFQVAEVLKGTGRTPLTLEFLGGTVGDTSLEIDGVPTFRVGEHAVLFVEKNGIELCPLVGLRHGKLRVERAGPTGPSILILPNDQKLTDVAEMGASAPDVARRGLAAKASPLTLEQFCLQVRQQVTRAGTP